VASTGGERPWTWRAADAEDFPVQARLFNACFGKTKDTDTFRWKYELNPHGPAVSRVALNTDGDVVGGYSYVPRWFRRDGKRLLLMQASDAMVDPSARRQRIFTGLDDIVCEAVGADGVPWVYAYSGRLSYQGFLRNGWQDIGQALVYRYRFKSARGLARMGRVAKVAGLASGLLDAQYARRDRRLARYDQDVAAVTRVTRFGPECDELFEATLPAVGLVGERDHAWLNWRYIDNPGRRQECWMLPAEGGGAPLGWLVAEFQGGNAFLVDHLARDDEVRARLLAAFTSMAHARGMHEATALLFRHHPAVPLLTDLGYAPPRRSKLFRDSFPWIVRACCEDADDADLSIDRWHLADGDRDAEHMSP